MPRSHLVGETGVVRRGAAPLPAQPFSERVHFAARRAVDDPRLVLVPRQNLQKLTVEVAASGTARKRVGATDGADGAARIAQAELVDNVAPDAFGCGRGEGVQRDAR